MHIPKLPFTTVRKRENISKMDGSDGKRKSTPGDANEDSGAPKSKRIRIENADDREGDSHSDSPEAAR